MRFLLLPLGTACLSRFNQLKMFVLKWLETTSRWKTSEVVLGDSLHWLDVSSYQDCRYQLDSWVLHYTWSHSL